LGGGAEAQYKHHNASRHQENDKKYGCSHLGNSL
jgi:hypothetical protein